METPLPPTLVFDRFELDLSRYELRRGARRIKLQRVPMELLIVLVEKRGALASREEIVNRLWGAETIVDTERSINTAIRKIRQALDDDADRPQFVETVVGKGYRFVAEVSSPAAELPLVEPQAAVEVRETPQPVRRKSKLSSGVLRAAALAMIPIGALALWLSTGPRSAEPLKITPFTALPGTESGPAFSPEGTQVAFAWADADGRRQHIYVKSVGAGSPVRLTSAPERDSDPSWSPDGGSIAFLREIAQNSLAVYVMSATGGSERRLHVLNHANHFRPAWAADGRALAVMDSEPQGAGSGIFLLSIQTGNRRRLTTAPATASGDWSPAFSPDGRTLAFLRNAGSALTTLLYSLPVDRSGAATGEPRMIPTDRNDLTGLDWSADGRSLICATHAGLIRIPVSGGPAERLPFSDVSQPSVSRRGNRLVYMQSVEDTDIFEAPGPAGSGDVRRLISSTRADGAPQYSPDGKRAVFISERTGMQELWISDNEGQHVEQLTFSVRGAVGSPRWAPDGARIAFDSTERGHGDIHVISVNGGPGRQITLGAATNVRPSWSRDGKWIYFGSDRSGSWQIWKTTPQGGTPIQVTFDGGREAFEEPAGRFLYFTKGQRIPGIWRMPVSGGPAERVSEDGAQGRWAPGERGIYYLDSQDRIQLLEYSTGRHFPLSLPGLGRPSGSGGGLLSIRPGDRSILVTVLARTGSDLTLVEGFR